MKQFHPNKIGLQSMMKMNEILSNPLKDIPVIHVAGTNGKV
jgi:folylpolyglutamate synthase/dihydropteroate synthase